MSVIPLAMAEIGCRLGSAGAFGCRNVDAWLALYEDRDGRRLPQGRRRTVPYLYRAALPTPPRSGRRVDFGERGRRS